MNQIIIMNKDKNDLETPCLILDQDILEQNLSRMQALAESKGKNLRPHAKTHKCITLAKKQIEYGAIGVCAAKISEAELLAKAGIEGILVTGPIASNTGIKKIIDILVICPSLMITLDSQQTAETLDNELKKVNLKINVLLDIDAGLHRTGVKPSDALKLGKYILSKNNLRLCGIQAYAGQLQHITSFKERRSAAFNCMKEVIPVFNKLKSENDDFMIFSASGTGTFEIDLEIPEITEHQAGSYVFMDSEYLQIESSEASRHFELFKPALRLLTTVVSTNQTGFVTVDAGLKSLYKDGGEPQIITPEFSGLKYDWFGDEYGKVIYNKNQQAPALGTVLELITSHCDPTINLFDHIYVTKGSKVVDIWEINLRGCSQ
jgi:D-serine deaminase-like pyridoxal phosphate-dependent protein